MDDLRRKRTRNLKTPFDLASRLGFIALVNDIERVLCLCFYKETEPNLKKNG